MTGAAAAAAAAAAAYKKRTRCQSTAASTHLALFAGPSFRGEHPPGVIRRRYSPSSLALFARRNLPSSCGGENIVFIRLMVLHLVMHTTIEEPTQSLVIRLGSLSQARKMEA